MLRLITIAILALWAPPASAERHALVVGIDEYQSISDLQKARNDAIAVSEVLEANGFNVTTLLDADQREFSAAVSALASTLSEDDEAFFYFAGHGVEVDGRNYLLPADIPALTAGDEFLLDSTSISADRALSAIQGSGARVTVMVLDACRDNPFSSDGRRSLGQSRGLAAIEVPEGAFIIYSAGVGQSALDRLSDDDPDPNSVFTRVLLPLLRRPDLPIHEVARQIRRDVSALASSINHDQRPAYYDEMLGEFLVAENTNISTEEAYQRGREFRYGLNGREVDLTEAVRWYRRAAEQGHAEAQFWFGRLYYEGLGVTQDYTEAAQWYQLAAEQGLDLAQLSLGALYSAGRGVPQDYAEAAQWIRMAAERGMAGAQHSLGHQYYEGLGVTQDYTEAAQWYRLAAEQGHDRAQYGLGFMYYEGLGVTQDYAEAAQWIRMAAEQGLDRAQYGLGFMYYEGLGVTQDYAEAAQWIRMAAEQGLDRAQYGLGLMYERGVGVSQDYAEAARWYRLAAEQGYTLAQNKLAFMYREGRGVPQDEDEARRWAQLASGHSPADLGALRPIPRPTD